MGAEQVLSQAGIVLPEPPSTGGNYVSAKTVGSLVYLAGVISTGADGVMTGTAGLDRSIEEGYAAARACALTQLAVLRRHLGSLDAVQQIVSVNGYVNAAPGFADPPKVINGASDLLVQVFGEAGRHVRAAIGVSSLPRNALVEMQMVVAIEPGAAGEPRRHGRTMSEHRLSAEPTHSVWDCDVAPRLAVAPGDVVHMECVDASGGQVKPGSTLEDFLAIDRTRIHALTGPIAVKGAEPGDVLQIDVVEVAHKGWAWSSVLNGLGFLDERFADPYLFHWALDGELSRSLAPAVVPLRPFCGVMGVAPAATGQIRTRPPGPFGGNMDVRELSAGATLYLPVFHRGALFSAGDAHAAQGDGEVCINGMECPADVTLRFSLHKRQPLAGPMIESAARRGEEGPEWIVVESGTDAFSTAQAATNRMVDLLSARWGFSPIHAYILCSVAMRLRLSQVVNRPMVTVSAAITKSVLPERRLF